jgi:cysteine desulfurase/selenocysteine lyase
VNLRADFPLLANNPGIHYLDSAATSQKPRVVLDALVDFYETANANPHRGAYALSVRATERYNQARERIARFLGVGDPDCRSSRAERLKVLILSPDPGGSPTWPPETRSL